MSGIDGSTPTRLTTSPGFDGEPAFSPDGSQSAFQSERDGDEEIYLMSADGSAQTRLTENPGADHSPAFSPEGDRVVFVRNLEGAGESLSRIGVDGTGFARVHTDGGPGRDKCVVTKPRRRHQLRSCEVVKVRRR